MNDAIRALIALDDWSDPWGATTIHAFGVADAIHHVAPEAIPRQFLTAILAADIGKNYLDREDCPTCGHGRRFWIHDAIGRVQPSDVGKLVYRVGVPGHRVTQVENSEQRDARRNGV